MLLFYNVYIKSHFEYCCVNWGNSYNFNMPKNWKLQRRAWKIILGNDYSTFENDGKQLNIFSFEETMFIHKAKLMYKIANNVAPIFLKPICFSSEATTIICITHN